MERLQKIIANSGYCSRRKAENLIEEGKVYVNGKIVSTLGFKVDGNVDIVVDGKQINRNINKGYYLLNKPRGVVSTSSDEKNRKTVTCNSDFSFKINIIIYETINWLILQLSRK